MKEARVWNGGGGLRHGDRGLRPRRSTSRASPLAQCRSPIRTTTIRSVRKDREILACVVQLGPNQSDRWAYALTDEDGRPNSDVKYREPVSGAACAAMAYPVGHVVLAGGTGEYFNGKIAPACRH